MSNSEEKTKLWIVIIWAGHISHLIQIIYLSIFYVKSGRFSFSVYTYEFPMEDVGKWDEGGGGGEDTELNPWEIGSA